MKCVSCPNDTNDGAFVGSLCRPCFDKYKALFINPQVHGKAWGSEAWLINDEYCVKMLKIGKNKKFSMHFHVDKHEIWHVLSGRLIMSYINTDSAHVHTEELLPGVTVEIKRYMPHQLYAMEDSVIFEVSTTHHDSDSYRIWKGDSQL